MPRVKVTTIIDKQLAAKLGQPAAQTWHFDVYPKGGGNRPFVAKLAAKIRESEMGPHIEKLEVSTSRVTVRVKASFVVAQQRAAMFHAPLGKTPAA
jgi:hypothetical protein